MIEVKNLRKNYGSKSALKGISFSVEQGEIFGFLGPNGAGKTTTIRILTGQLLPSYGEARVAGEDVVRDIGRLKPIIGVAPEKANLYERLMVGQNMEFFCRLYGCDFRRIDTLLDRVKLLDEKRTQVKKLSKGMKQRVLLARTLLHEPRVLFLDEPTAGLDPSSANDIHQLLVELNRAGTTILLTSHNMEEVDKLCHRVAFIDQGLIVASGTPEELKLQHAKPRMRLLVQGASGLEEQEIDLAGEESARLMADWIQQGKIRSVHSCEPTLAEIFTKVAGSDLA